MGGDPELRGADEDPQVQGDHQEGQARADHAAGVHRRSSAAAAAVPGRFRGCLSAHHEGPAGRADPGHPGHRPVAHPAGVPG
eukprot:4366800-Heterocapsa_arctica.AAC.1